MSREHKSKTKIFRQRKTDNYTIVNNDILRRKDLSWKAKGILIYVLSLPNDWTIYLEEVMKHSTDGRDSFRSGWKELERVGYVKRFAYKEKGIIKEWRTIVSESADLTTFSPDTDFPQVEKPQVEKPQVENPKLQSTKELSTNKQSTDDKEIRTSSAELTNDFEGLWLSFPNKKGKKKALSSYKTAIKNGSTNEQIKTGIENYKKYLEKNSWLKPAHGSTWFAQERWDDEYDMSLRSGGYDTSEYDDLF